MSVLSRQDCMHTSRQRIAAYCCSQIGQLTRCGADSPEGCAQAGGMPSMHTYAFLVFVLEALYVVYIPLAQAAQERCIAFMEARMLLATIISARCGPSQI